jgi:S1-C subfamily serine protease
MHDPDDATQRHDLHIEPAPTEPVSGRYSPEPEPRAEWGRSVSWTDPSPDTTPERWYEPADPAPATTSAPPPPPARRGGVGTVVAAALLSAVLASGGTVAALTATGALDRPETTTVTPTGETVSVRQPVTIDESSATIDVAAAVSPAVVRIITGSTDVGNMGIIPETGVGSGVIFDPDGWILTNRHVVEGSGGLRIELKDGRSYTGRIYGIDTLTDLAIVRIDASDLPTAALGDSDALRVGQLVIAIGSPLGTYSNSVTSGIVSAKGRSITTDTMQQLTNLIQTDAAINPGNSGGPLLDASGNVIGINTAIARDSTGIGFAIPIDIAKPIMDQALAGEELARPYLGIRYRQITLQMADEENLPVDQGALVGPGQAGGGGQTPAVEPNGPADAAGIQEGDIIVRIEGQTIDSEHPLDATLSHFAPGRTVDVEILRDGEPLTLQVTLGTRPSGL